MATQTQTFPCPFCGRRMGVGIELLGKHVRCPHCKQVVLAPAATAALQPAGHASTATPPPAAASPLRHPLDLESSLDFNFPKRKELADSILSDRSESEDEVISSRKGEKPVPIIPDGMSASCLPATEPLPGPVALDLPSSEMPTIEVRKPSGVTTPNVPPPKPHTPTPVPAPVVFLPAQPAQSAPPANPFAFDPTSAPALKLPPEPTPPPANNGSRAGPVSHYRALVIILATYAALMTALAVYGLFFKPVTKGGTFPPPAATRGATKSS